MINSLTKVQSDSFDDFQNVIFNCAVSNVIFAGRLCELRWLPAFAMAPLFAGSVKIAEKASVGFLNYLMPEECRNDTHSYYQENPHLGLLYLVSFFSLSILGSAALGKTALTLFGRAIPFKSLVLMASLDFIPYYAGILFQRREGTDALSHTISEK